MKLESQRHLFDIPDDVTYLNCAYMSPLMHRANEAGAAGLARKQRPWEIAVDDFFTDSDHLREAFAEIVHAERDDIAIVASASYGISTAAHSLPLSSGQSVLVAVEQFPSNVYPWREAAREAGARVVTLERPSHGDWTQAVVEAIDASTAVVALPQVHWIDGGLLDLERIGEACRDRGAALVLDATQSAGAYPIDVRRIQPDFLVAATYKWLMGPYSLGLLYVSKRWQEEGRSLEHNWIHRRNAENFARLVDYEDEPAHGARRFDVGERSNFALVPAALEALRQILAWGVDDVSETCGGLARTIAAECEAMGLRSLPEGLRAPHYLGLMRDGGYPPDLLARLAEQRVFVSVRGDAIRVTPHVYNDTRDVDRFLEALRGLV